MRSFDFVVLVLTIPTMAASATRPVRIKLDTVPDEYRKLRGAFGTRLRIENTGHCLVTAEHTKHAEDDGWEIRRFSALDTYFETR